MKQVQCNVLTFSLSKATAGAGNVVVTGVTNAGVFEFGTGLLFGWLKIDVLAGAKKNIVVGWKVTSANGTIRDVYQRPIYVDANTTAYTAPAYTIVPAAGYDPEGGEEIGFVLYNPSIPVPFPLILASDKITFTVTGIALVGESVDSMLATMRLMYEEERV